MINLQLWKQKKKELSLNYTEIANLAGVSKRSVEDIFRGYTKSPRIDTLEAIEHALGLDTARPTVTAEDKALGIQEVPLFPLTEEEQDLLELRSEIIRIKGEEFWKTLETMLQAIAKEKK